jgi:hypothetical protein
MQGGMAHLFCLKAWTSRLHSERMCIKGNHNTLTCCSAFAMAGVRFTSFSVLDALNKS